jgi:RNA polymerase sigma-70 factor (ECF subfamily)
MYSTPIAEIVLTRLPTLASGPPELRDELQRELEAAVERARQTWPGIDVDATSFVHVLVDRLLAFEPSRATAIVAALRALHVGDLYIARACAFGDDDAISAFERTFLVEVDDALTRMGFAVATCDEVKQVLRLRYFIGDDDRKPAILDYSGRGDLRRWVRASGVREALRMMRSAKKIVNVDQTVLEVVAGSTRDLELDFLKRAYGAAFDGALRDAFDGLLPRDRNLLRYHYGKGLTVDELGTLYRVHRATAARRIQRASTELIAKMRERLAARLGIERQEVSSVLRLLQSQIEIALHGLLATPHGA